MDSAPDPRRWWGLAAIGLSQLMVVLDMTIVNIALPTAQADLGISDADRQWVITAYTLAFGGLLLLGGRLGDVFGRKRVLIIGLSGFAVASAIGGFSQSLATLLVARALQGVFAALLAPAALSMLNVTFTEPRERARALGVYGAIAGGGAALGLMLGGLLTQYVDWRWTLAVNVPIAIVAVIGTVMFLRDHSTHGIRARLDIPGAILASGGLLAIVYGLSEAEQNGWGSTVVVSALALGLLLMTAFVLVERRTPRALLPLHLLRDRNRVGALLAVGLTQIGMFGVFLFLTYYLQGVQGYSPMKTGLAFLPMVVGMMTGAVGISARLLPRIGPRRLMLPGLLIAASALAFLTQIEPGSTYLLHVMPGLVFLGLGMGMTFMPSMATATGGVRGTDAGVVSATLNTTQQVGGSIGIALLNTVAATATANWIVANGAAAPAEMAQAAVHGFTTAMWISVGAVLLAALLAALLINVSPTHAKRDDVGEPAGARPREGDPLLSDEESPAGMHA
ncbi:MFS transporter [Demequina sp. TTPB684]|uniref:MFS transporter n=1 Tax=unclassified Demequina TaxID=2620311 RepID=UPI001CF10289|nr:MULTISPECIES: MFS transporter [unclassified Demequina]MCB2411762.1 MFS transporter [Demequina sp. TTPB684]UPU88648.1 MFS transporter [Demequina sp. TMPB413]